MTRHSTWILGAAWLAASLIGAPTASVAQGWKLVEQYERVDGFLSDRQPEAGRYENWEVYDEPTAKFYSVFSLGLEEGRVFMVDVYSYDFQPIIMVQDQRFNVLGRGTFMDPIVEQNGIAYHTRLEFHAPWTGYAELLISSELPDQGTYAMEWSTWGPDGAPAGTAASPAPSDVNCNCQDPATGRRFQSAFTDLGECYPEHAVAWCD